MELYAKVRNYKRLGKDRAEQKVYQTTDSDSLNIGIGNANIETTGSISWLLCIGLIGIIILIVILKYGKRTVRHIKKHTTKARKKTK